MNDVKKVLGEYFAHLLVGAALFTGLLLVAVLVSVLTKWVGTWTDDLFLVQALTCVKYAIFVLDVVLLLRLLWTMVRKAIKNP